MTLNKCRYCGGNNLKRMFNASHLFLDAYDQRLDSYICNDCKSRTKSDISSIGKFIKDYRKLCKKHKMFIGDWGICEGPVLSEQMTIDRFDELLNERIHYIIEKSSIEQKKVRFKNEKEKEKNND